MCIQIYTSVCLYIKGTYLMKLCAKATWQAIQPSLLIYQCQFIKDNKVNCKFKLDVHKLKKQKLKRRTKKKQEKYHQ